MKKYIKLILLTLLFVPTFVFADMEPYGYNFINDLETTALFYIAGVVILILLTIVIIKLFNNKKKEK